jgi:hypothetical protein
MGERTFAKERDRLRDSLGNLADLADERESPAVAEAARALDKKLVENRSNVVVLGEFKRGKTTFVNALVGAEMLPSAVVPLTSIVTTVAHGESPDRLSRRPRRERLPLRSGPVRDRATRPGQPTCGTPRGPVLPLRGPS